MTGSCTGTVDVIAPCTPNWLCYYPLNGYAYDTNACGPPDRPSVTCTPTLVASNNVRYSSLSEVGTPPHIPSSFPPVWTVMKTIIITQSGSGSIRIKWDMRSTVNFCDIGSRFQLNGNYLDDLYIQNNITIINTGSGCNAQLGGYVLNTITAQFDYPITLTAGDTIILTGAVTGSLSAYWNGSAYIPYPAAISYYKNFYIMYN